MAGQRYLIHTGSRFKRIGAEARVVVTVHDDLAALYHMRIHIIIHTAFSLQCIIPICRRTDRRFDFNRMLLAVYNAIRRCNRHFRAVFFIDELDRCNPAYAVKVLERVKHLFDIPNIIFVLAVNKQQLGCAIQGYFGSSQMDADEYLRRFIDIEYTLPEPDMEKYCKMLYGKYEFGQFFHNNKRLGYFGNHNEAGVFTETASRILQHLHLNLREVDKIFAHTRLALASFDTNTYLLPDVFFLLCLWKVNDSAFYKKLRHHKLSVQDLLSEFENRFSAIMEKRSDIYAPIRYVALDYTLAALLNCYNITDQGLCKEGELVDYDENSKPRLRLPLNSKYINKTELANLLSDSRRREHCRYGLSYIFVIFRHLFSSLHP